MNQNKISLAKKTLKYLEKKKLRNINLKNFLSNNKVQHINNKIDLILNINDFFYFLLKQNLVNIEKSSQRDMLFEIMMARYDILNEYRISVKNIINHFMYRPKDVLKFISKLVESKILIATFANINLNGIQGILKIKIIFGLYYITLFTWYNDENENLEKTMSVLDKYFSLYFPSFISNAAYSEGVFGTDLVLNKKVLYLPEINSVTTESNYNNTSNLQSFELFEPYINYLKGMMNLGSQLSILQKIKYYYELFINVFPTLSRLTVATILNKLNFYKK